MKTKLLYFLMCSIGLHILQAQSQFDRKKHQGAALGQPPKQRRGAQVIDGRKQSNLHRIAPKGNLKNTLANLAKQAKLSKPFDKVRTIHSPETGMPIFITTTPQGANASRLGVNYDKRQATYTYLTQLQTAVPSLDPEKFEIENVSGDNEGNTHVRLAQTFGGFKVYGAEVMVHLDAAGNGKVFNGNYYPINAASIKATLPVQAAINLAISDLSKKTKYTNLPQFHKDLLAYEGPEVLDTLLYQVPNTQSFTLAYQISVHPNVVEHWEYFIDAVQGNILHAYKTTCHAGPTTATATDLNGVSRTIHTYQESTSVYTMVDASKSMFNPNEGTGVIQTLDAKGTFGENFSTTEITSTNNVWNNRSAVSAHFNAGVAYDYFKKTHGRESIDNKGGTIYS
ncbi:MAG TPA: hypothetical protein VL947_08620, partial [Cytophagales bacterium]|nr:hypothetical protein [Cytophagales bacterium]